MLFVRREQKEQEGQKEQKGNYKNSPSELEGGYYWNSSPKVGEVPKAEGYAKGTERAGRVGRAERAEREKREREML